MKREHQQGFALIAALLAILIITAVGILVFTITTQDIRTSTRIVGEKKAFAAAEAGVHKALQSADLSTASSGGWVQVDPATDPDSRYSYSSAGGGGTYSQPPPGYDIEEWSESVYDATVTGENTRYNSSVQIDTGLAEFHSGSSASTTD